MKPKQFRDACAQGDVLIRRVAALPAWANAVTSVSGRVIVTHSETGHDHVMMLDCKRGAPAVVMYNGPDPLISWLQVNRPTALQHLRPYDTHDPIMIDTGLYEVRRQREYTPEGMRRVED